MKNRRCGNCGSLSVQKASSFGPFPWGDYPKVFLLNPLSIDQCQGSISGLWRDDGICERR